jgi:DNA-binding transcriptional MerR regulator
LTSRATRAVRREPADGAALPLGLLDAIDRSPSDHRRLHHENLEWLGVLRCLRDTGMPIAQMRRYAELARCGDATLALREKIG